MSFSVEEKRRVVPRWRDYRVTAATGELNGLGLRTKARTYSQAHFNHKLEQWRSTPNFGIAADIVASAFAMGQESDAIEAARFVLASPNAPDSISGMAAAVLIATSGERNLQVPSNGNSVVQLEHASSNASIHNLRHQLADDPRNSIGWAEMARQYAILGFDEKAVRAMRTALSLAPTNRFILRCAARMYVHLNQPDVAHALLRRNPATRNDPWLMATEISVAAVAERTPRFTKAAREAVSSGAFSSADVTELCSALATLDLTAGSAKKARKLFNQSLIHPTDNSVAQAAWATKHLSTFELKPHHLEVPRSFEARALKAYQTNEWSASVAECQKWTLDEPFSSQPAIMGSFICLVALRDYSKAMEFTTTVLPANTDDPMLLNNRAVAQIELGNVAEAAETFARISMLSDAEEDATFIATEGLIAFRQGDVARGRNCYRDAMQRAGKTGDRLTQLLALTHYAREELLAKTNEGEDIFATTLAVCSAHPQPILAPMVEYLKELRHGYVTGSASSKNNIDIGWLNKLESSPIPQIVKRRV